MDSFQLSFAEVTRRPVPEQTGPRVNDCGPTVIALLFFFFLQFSVFSFSSLCICLPEARGLGIVPSFDLILVSYLCGILAVVGRRRFTKCV